MSSYDVSFGSNKKMSSSMHLPPIHLFPSSSTSDTLPASFSVFFVFPPNYFTPFLHVNFVVCHQYFFLAILISMLILCFIFITSNILLIPVYFPLFFININHNFKPCINNICLDVFLMVHMDNCMHSCTCMVM